MSVTKNYIYNLTYQILLLILPIITVPYITRVLGTSGIGINSYTNSIIQYFIIFGSIGVSLYGNRTIAYFRDHREKLSRQFWSLFVLKLFTTLLAFAVFVIYICLFNYSYKTYLWIQSINIISAAIDVSWLLMGIEDFRKTVSINLIIKIISVILIFTFIKTKSDLWLYILINGLSALAGQLVLWIYIPRIVDKCKITLQDINSHFIPCLKVFIPQVATQIYCIFDKTLVGYFGSVNEAGIYDMGEKIVYMSLTLVTAMGTVMLPRITNTVARGDMDKVKEYTVKSFNFVSYLAVPMCFGLIGISKGFSVWFFGKEFLKSGYVMSIESCIIILIAWTTVTGTQFMLSLGKTNEFTISVTLGAVVDIICNLILVRYLFSIGAAISTVAAEISVTLIQMYLLRRLLPFKCMFKDMWKYLVSSLIMYCTIMLITRCINYTLIATIVQIIAGMLVYFITQYLLKSEFQNYVCGTLKNKLLLKKL